MDRATIELRGVVTHFDEQEGILYLQDATGAQAFEVGDLGAPVVAGQQVLLAGRLERGAALPRLVSPRITVLRQSTREVELEARRLSLESLVAYEGEAEWVEIQGTVRSAVQEGESLVLEVEHDGVGARVRIIRFADPFYPPIVGARLRLRGAGAARAHRLGQQPPAHLLIPSIESIRIIEDPPEDKSASAPAQSRLPLLVTADEVRRLSPQEAAKGHPVRLRAVVTYNDAEEGLLFVQDGTAGIYVESWRHIHDTRPGDRVEVLGRSAPGAFAPIVEGPRLRVLAKGPLPPARRVRPGRLLTGAEDSQWVEVEGVVRTFNLDRYGVELRIADGAFRLTVRIPGNWNRPLMTSLVNARVRVRGTCRSVLTLENQLAYVVLHTPNLESLRVLERPSSEPWALPVLPVNTLLHFPGDTARDWEHRMRVQGTVTYSQPGVMYIQDATGSVSIRSNGLPRAAIGDVVDAVGFATAGEYKPVMEDAAVRTLGRGEAPPAVAMSPEHGFSGRFDASLVKLEARLLDSVGGHTEQRLSMRAGPYLFTATLHGAGPLDVRPGSHLRLRGICALGPTMDLADTQAFRILLRTPDDIEVLRTPPWWNPQHAAWVLTAMAALIGLSLTWVTTLRRRVQRQSALIWERVKRETELQERQRMARELHDTLEQNLAGIGLCVEAASRALPGKVKVAEEHLALAVEQVSAGVEEVRRSVWALRAHALDTSGLGPALDELGQQLARCSPTPIDVGMRVHGDSRPFPLAVENALFRIGQEALTNAVRYSQAAHITIELYYGDDAFRLRVCDDGRGFDNQGPQRPGHFGLVGMRERADAIGGQLAIRSAAGAGTEIEVIIPLRPIRMLQAG